MSKFWRSAAEGGGESCRGCGSSGGDGAAKSSVALIPPGDGWEKSSNGFGQSSGEGVVSERERAGGCGGGGVSDADGVWCCWADCELVVASLEAEEVDEEEDEVRVTREGLRGDAGECGG